MEVARRSRAAFARRSLSLLAAVAALATLPLAAKAADEAEILRLRGETLAARGRCEEALPVLERAHAAAPGDARILLRRGQCLIQLQRYPAALETLEAAQRLAPVPDEVPLHVGIARYHMGDLDGAQVALAQARQRTPGRAEIDLYEGLIQLQRAQTREAAASLERARRINASSVEPVASFYEGLAWASSAERARAREALERVKRDAPGTPWAEAAERALERLDQVAGERMWLEATGGIEYDDNVVLRGTGVTLPDEIAGQHDARAVWSVEGGWELLRSGPWSLGAMLSYYGNAHDDLEDFDVQWPQATLWVDNRLTESTTARLQYDFGYAWVGNEPFLTQHVVTPQLFHVWDLGVTRFFVEYERNNFRFPNDEGPGGPPGVNEETERNRDGYEIEPGVDHVIPLEIGWDGTSLRGGYHYHYYSARGSEYSWQGHELIVGARVGLPWKFVFDVEGTYLYAPFRNPSTHPDPPDVVLPGGVPLFDSSDRSDDVYAVEVTLERPLNKYLTAAVRYYYISNHSNVQVFDYDREIVGAYLTARFAR